MKDNKTTIKISKDRLEVLNKISEKEKLGGEHFFEDVENDPPTKTLLPEDVDYLKKKINSKIKNFFCKKIVKKMVKKFVKDYKIKVVGLENLDNIKTGAIITSNHFNYFDSGPIIYALSQIKQKHKHHIVIREGNYQIPGKFGFILKNYNTFPLSSSIETTKILNKTIDNVLTKGDFVIVYPEQSMWWFYKKPRNYRIGAFRFASRNNVPIIPCFVTMEDMDEYEDNGLKKQKLTLHILKPLYPDANLSVKQNAENMLLENKKLVIECYENFYNKKLVY